MKITNIIQNKLPCYVPGFISSSKFTSCLFDG